MAYTLSLPKSLAKQGWKVKIREDERTEDPHVSIIFKHRTWRLNLRTRGWLDTDPPPRDVPSELVAFVGEKMELLRRQWNQKYPENPVFSKENEK